MSREEALKILASTIKRLQEGAAYFRPKKSTVDLAGSGAEYATPDEMKKLLDRLREEDV